METHSILQRLKRIEGQVRGIQKMVENKRYCTETLNQIAAVRSAIDQVGLALLENHMQDCFLAAVEKGEEKEHLKDLMQVIKHYLK